MKILITAAGFIATDWRKPCSIAARWPMQTASSRRSRQIALIDIGFPVQTDARLKCVKGDFTNAALLAETMGRDTARCSIWRRW
jgi:hypothetical protein